ncbi:hypothetical protein, variant 1 [Phytophthora nicotianae P1569]|uniref:Rotatin N-terminal domain-containing protein n=2 Tax=Phytophthora nicotianae P1569 TaxID=1317065 RepID=V9DZR1_PHYNI|nr:hypothetical protein, variant 1 [Phytophthora nicotianae P1569]
MESGRLDALVLKLRHPLTKIRSRALRTLLFKLRERLVRWQELESLQSSLIPGLISCLEPPSELEALHVLELLVQSHSEVFLASLQHFGAAQKFQRAAHTSPELQASYEKLLRQIYATKFVPIEDENREQVSRLEEEEEEADVEQYRASKVQLERRRAPSVEVLEAGGWKFAQVTLTSVDDQYLFEFEVKLQLRTETRDIVAACATFRNELLRNFPAEVFLQRPTVLQYLLHLVQQPILPGSPGTTSRESGDGDVLMEKAMEVSLGVNYFDEILSETFSNKRGNLCGAVAMASLKAIESFLYALKLSRSTCLDPTYVVHAPNVHVELFDSYDTRRVLYPRVNVEVGDGVGRTPRQRGDSTDRLEQYSMSGAIYRIFISVLPLMRSARHPRLHLLNLLISALPDLPERSCGDVEDTSVQELDKLRLERILGILSGICRPVPREQAGNTMVDNELELTHSMTWKLVELVLRLLRLYPSSHYHVEEVSNAAERNGSCAKTGIIVPRLLWEAVKLWTANPVFPNVAAHEWKDESLIQDLSGIDSSIPAFMKLKQSSQQDAKLILEFVDFAKAHREKLTDFGPLGAPAILNLEVSLKTIQARFAFDDVDTEIIADATLQAIWLALASYAENDITRPTENDIDGIQFILCDLLSVFGEKKAPTSHDPMVCYFFRGLMVLINNLSKESKRVSTDFRHRFFTDVLCDPKFLVLLLLTLARQDTGSQANNAAFWAILRAALNHLADVSSDKLVLLQPVIPLLQHFAYIELSEGSSPEQRSTQPQLAEVLNRVETIVPDHTRYLLMCRCLLHESSYIRKAAASGILRLLSQVYPSCVDWISKHKEILDDPFGGTFDYSGKNVNLEATLMETPLPASHASEYQPSESELSSRLSKLSHLYKVISGSSCGFKSMKEAALTELVMFIEHASVEMFTLFEELDKFSDIMDVLRAIFETKAGRDDSTMILQALILFRTLLLRSRLLRFAMRHDSGMMKLLMPLVYHPSPSIRAQMYYIILLLTCSAENFIPKGAPIEFLNNGKPTANEDARVPDMIKSTFGLYASRWTRCFIVTCSLEQQLQASSGLLAKQTDSSWLQEVKKSIVTQASLTSDGDKEESGGEIDLLLGAEYTLIAQKLRDAPSHGKCLNAAYHVMTICVAWRCARERFVEEWEADFERYFAVPPKTERDEVIVGALVNTLSVMFCGMTRAEQLRALVVVKRKVLSLLKRSQSKAFSLQVARLLLNVSESKVSDLFLSLATDTDIISTICAKYTAIYATEPVLHSMMLEILLRFARGMNENAGVRLSEPSRGKICKRLLEMLSPLLTVVCRHRVPGSFMERDVFAVGSQCMVAILQTLPHESLLASDSPLEHTDSSILLDSSWASRFLFDHVAPIRELGFRVIEHTAASRPSSSRLLEMALETSTDDDECDAVRAAACTALTAELLRYHDRSPDRQAALVKMCHGAAFAGKVLRSLSEALKGSKLLARTASAFARLVRVLCIQRNDLASHFGDMQKELEAAEEESDIYPLLIQMLSLREWKDKANRFSSCCMLLPSCDDNAWRRSLLSAILDLMAEVLNLLQAICRDGGFDQVAFFLMHTTLQYQLMELVRDVHASLGVTVSPATRRRHYDVLDLSAGTLSILLVQAFDQRNEYDVKQFGAPQTPGFGVDFVDTVAKLLAPQQPVDFRVSFSRIVPAMSLLIPGSLKSPDVSVTSALCSVVFDLYQEVAEFRPLDASTATSDLQGRVFPLASVRRVSCALQVLLETSPHLQPLVQVKRGVPFAMASIKESFTAIRIAGGFGGKRARSSNSSSNTHDIYVLDLCGRIQTHMEVVSSIIGNDKESQQVAKDEGLLSVVLSNWNVMKTAHVRGSQLMLRALQLLANYIYGNDSARSSMLISLSGRGDNAQTLLSLLFDLASTRGDVTSTHNRGTNCATEADMALSNAACQVLKAALINPECVQGSVKSGSISRLVDALQDRLKQARQTSKTNHTENENVAHMLSVLSSIASTEEGARVLYTSLSTVLSLVLDDVMHLTNKGIQRYGCLFLRNLSLSQATKNNFAVWEELLDELVAFCVRVSDSTQEDVISLECMSVALWSLVYDNQKARALLLSKPTTLRGLKQVLDSQNSVEGSSTDIAENLRRVLMLVHE